ncbi:hypothetical protein [Elioraea sp.]|uniref:hypothetical protein n=1 Tax=Elioraea sp. TaxID=2185103 RepID=UPI0025C4CFB9|nr:hypothetical protein [Elioraea sp.]
MNAELVRNLWLEITPQRLIAMPAVLGLVFAIAHVAEGADALRTTAWWMGLGLGVIWGTRQAAGAVMGEVAARTWDSQRASALTAAEMTFGKLFGATAYAWYGVAICLAVFLAAGGDVARGASLGLRVLFAHGVALFASLALLALGGRALVLTSLPHLAGILAGAGMDDPLAWAVEETGWYGLGVDGAVFALATSALFCGWSVLGAWRLMGRELTVPQRRWAWPAFAVFVAAFAGGFGWSEGAVGALRAAFLATTIAVAAAALLEPKSRGEIVRLLGGRVGDAPPSVQALALAAILAVLLGFRGVAVPEVMGSDFATLLPVSVVLFLARDIALTRLVALRAGGVRGAVTAIVWFVVLYAAVPGLLGAVDVAVLLPFFLPVPVVGLGAGTFLTLGAPAVQAVLLWALLAGRVRTGRAGRPALPTTGARA